MIIIYFSFCSRYAIKKIIFKEIDFECNLNFKISFYKYKIINLNLKLFGLIVNLKLFVDDKYVKFLLC